MSSTNAAFSDAKSLDRKNPDSRRLPSGWVEQYDPNYNAWFYVNTYATPPAPQWTHPAYTPISQFAPPTGPPPVDSNSPRPSYSKDIPPPEYYNSSHPPPQNYNNSYPGGSSSPYPQQQNYVVDSNRSGGGSFGGLLGKFLSSKGHKGHGCGNSPRGYYGGGGYGYGNARSAGVYPPMASPYGAYAKPPKRGGGLGGGAGLALGAGAGLLGGALIADAVDDYGDAAYAEGLQDGGDFGGGDFGGGDFGGGDFGDF